LKKPLENENDSLKPVGATPTQSQEESIMKSKFLRIALTIYFGSLLCLPFAMAANDPPIFTTNVLYTFPFIGPQGSAPEAELIQGADGNFYGTTFDGGTGQCSNGSIVIGCGTIYSIAPSGVETVLFNFTYDADTNSSVNGIWPTAGLVQGPDGSFYGTAQSGGNNQAVCNAVDGCGTIFRITSKGVFSLLHQFCSNQCSDGSIEGGQPVGRLLLASDGNFYGVTIEGGFFSQGTVYRITPSGKITILYYFNGNENGATDGLNPAAGLIEGKDGNLYGTTQFGGLDGAGGTIFKMTKGGVETILHNWVRNGNGDFPDGSQPRGALIQASDGNFYGTTYFSSNGGIPVLGTLFRLTRDNVFTKLYDFNLNNTYSGIGPGAGVIQASDGNLYGTTTEGGSSDFGTLYQSTLNGTVSSVFSYDCADDGATPLDVMLQAADGTFYVTAAICGTLNGIGGSGTIVQVSGSLPKPLPAVLEFVPAKAAVGKTVIIGGNHFIGTTKVSFNGTAATFKVTSTETITATVPPGATSGPVSVTNPGGTAMSAQSFTVLP